MALAVNDTTLTRVYSALTTAHFYQSSIWGSLGSRNYESALQSAYSVLIQTETFGTAVAERNRAELHSGFVNPTEPSTTSEVMVIDRAVETAQDIPMLDRIEGVLGAMLFDRAAREAAWKMADHVDDYFGTLISGVDYTAEAGVNNTNLGDGSAGVFIDAAGKASNDAAAELLLDACDELVLWAREKHLDGLQIGGPSLSDLYIVIHPRLALAASKALRKANARGTLNEVRGLVREAGILRYDTVMAGRVSGVDIYTSTKLAKPAGAAAAQMWTFYGGVRQGVEYASRPLNTRRVSAQTREAGGWVDTMGSMMQYSGKVVNDGLLHRFNIDANATD